jgi:hypothetical protein
MLAIFDDREVFSMSIGNLESACWEMVPLQGFSRGWEWSRMSDWIPFFARL